MIPWIWSCIRYLNLNTFIAGLALNYILQNNFKESVGMRPAARKIGVLITDGKSQDEVILTSKKLRDAGIELYAIGKRSIIDYDLSNKTDH